MWPRLDVQRIQNPIEQPSNRVEATQTVFFFREKHIVIRLTIAHGGLVRQQCFIYTHGLRQADSGRFVALDFWGRQTQIMKFAADDFYVFIFQLPYIPRA